MVGLRGDGGSAAALQEFRDAVSGSLGLQTVSDRKHVLRVVDFYVRLDFDHLKSTAEW